MTGADGTAARGRDAGSRGGGAGSGAVRWGVLSTANIGRKAVVPALQAADGARVVAVASRDAEQARSFADEAGVARHHGSYEALLDDPEVDAVYIPLPNSLHRAWTLRAVEAGKHVLCEKPLAGSEAECREMDAAARQAGVVLMEAFMYRFHPRTERLLAMVRDGVVGPPRMIRSAFTFRLRNRDDIRLSADLQGGALMDVGCYCVNASRTVAGAEPVEVQAVADWGPSGVDETLAGVLRFDDGALAHFDASLLLERRETLEVAGPEGVLRVPSAFLPGTDDVVIEEMRGRDGITEHRVAGDDEYRCMVDHVTACIRDGARPRYGADEAALNLRVIEALTRSARNGGRPEAVGG